MRVGKIFGVRLSRGDERMNLFFSLRCKAMGRKSLVREVKRSSVTDLSRCQRTEVGRCIRHQDIDNTQP